MASTIAHLALDSSGGESNKDFPRFPDLPSELRIRIWQMAYDDIPDTLVYRFYLQFSLIPDSEMSDEKDDTEELQAFLTPLKEVRDLTRDLRILRRVNTESRYEGERLFDSYLCLNQTEEGGTSDLCPPINLPWKNDRNFFSFVSLTECDLECLEKASTKLIAQVLKTIRLLGLDFDKRLVYGPDNEGDYSVFAQFILLFSQIREVRLVSDQLMSEADLDDINDEIRSMYAFSCWDDWVGRVQEDVIGSHCHAKEIVTRDDHLAALEEFVDSMFDYHADHSESADMLLQALYGMIFRTKEDYGYLLLDDETMEELLGDDMLSDDMLSDMLSDTFSDEMPNLLSEGDDDD